MTAVPVAAGIDAHEILESGNVLIIPDAPVELKAEDLAFILRIRQTGNHHKNIAYKPDRDRISGLDQAAAPVRERLRAVLRRYSQTATEIAGRLLPRYSEGWRPDYASLRAVEEAGRKLPFNKRNDLLHTDAFPTRPTNGGLILRIFWNLHLERPRVWLISDPFEKLAPVHADAAGLPRIAGRKRWISRALRRLGLPLKPRSPYDEFMLAFHDYLNATRSFRPPARNIASNFRPARCGWPLPTLRRTPSNPASSPWSRR